MDCSIYLQAYVYFVIKLLIEQKLGTSVVRLLVLKCGVGNMAGQ